MKKNEANQANKNEQSHAPTCGAASMRIRNNGMGVALVVVLHFVVLVMLVLCVVGPDVVFNRESRCSS